jgi:peptidoglycan hydrolase CwlO-like protein
MSIEEQIRTIAKDELQTQLDDIEKRMRSSFRKESNEIKEQIQAINTQLEDLGTLIADLNLRTQKLEEDLSNRFGLVVKLRKYTLDQLMSEYKRLTGTLRPDQEESPENAEI